MKRKIAVITGARAEYSYLKPLIKRLQEKENIELLVYVTGMHLLKDYGHTIDEIKRDFKITKVVDMKEKKDARLVDMAFSISEGVKEFAKAFKKDKPDMIVIFGDRIEPFAAATAAISMNIPIAHIEGGDKAFADLDNNLRYALTKLAHLHFPSTEASKQRILNLGEEPWRVHNVGLLTLDVILNQRLPPREWIIKKYHLQNKPFILIVNHPTLTEHEEAKKQMNSILKSSLEIAEQEDMQVIILYPNSYPGGFKIIEEIKKSIKNKRIHAFENLPNLEYLSLLKHSSIFVGNSSSGIVEAPSLGVPYVCIGKRQQGRERAKNVIDVDYNENEIVKGLKKALSDKTFLKKVKKCESPYGDGKASERITKILSEIDLNKKLLEKNITY